MAHAPVDRRRFLQQAGRATAATLAAGALPTIVSPRVLAGATGTAPSDRIRLGFIGVFGQGRQLLSTVYGKASPVDIVALCDVDSNVLAGTLEKVEKATGRKPRTYSDYRKLIDDPEIDAVVIATPDHWHALMATTACKAGKDVYCEKPLSLTVAEGQTMRAVARDTKRVVQTGSKQRTDARFRYAVDLVRSGRIGKVKTVKVGIAKVNLKGDVVPDRAPPPELDYDSWLGPAPQRAYNPQHVHYNFRFFWDYSGGQLTNWGAHYLDSTQWALGRDDSGPVSITGEARYNKQHLYEVPEWCRVEYVYDDGVRVICSQDEAAGMRIEGENGTVFVDRGKIQLHPTDIIDDPLPKFGSAGDMNKLQMLDWLACIRTRAIPASDFAAAHRSATVCHLGNIALRSGRKVTWDPVREVIVGDDEQASMLSRPYRAPWTLPT